MQALSHLRLQCTVLWAMAVVDDLEQCTVAGKINILIMLILFCGQAWNLLLGGQGAWQAPPTFSAGKGYSRWLVL